MVLGNTTQKIGRIVELAEELYERVNQLREQLESLRGTVEETNDRVGAIERELEEQRALLEAVAASSDVDVETVLGAADAGEDDP